MRSRKVRNSRGRRNSVLTRRDVVIIENLDPKDGVIGAETEIGNGSAGNEYDHAGIGVGRRL